MTNHKTPEQIVDGFCNCLFGDYHPVIRKFIENIGDFGDQTASQLLLESVLKMEPEEAQKALADAQKFKENNAMSTCLETFKSEIKALPESESQRTLELLKSTSIAKFVDKFI